MNYDLQKLESFLKETERISIKDQVYNHFKDVNKNLLERISAIQEDSIAFFFIF